MGEGDPVAGTGIVSLNLPAGVCEPVLRGPCLRQGRLATIQASSAPPKRPADHPGTSCKARESLRAGPQGCGVGGEPLRGVTAAPPGAGRRPEGIGAAAASAV